jgi:hypothetical protein
MTQYVFGTGQLYSVPQGGGNPLRIGALQDVSVEFSGDVKMLYGQYQFPLDVARGKTKIEGKIGSGNIDVAAFNTIFFGQTVTGNSEKKQAINEAGSVPASSTYTITVANAAAFSLDLGVTLVTTGQPLTQVASSPSAGQYSVSSGGVYTFNVAQASAAVLINYLYTATTANSGTLNINNQLMGTTPKFQLVASQTYNSKVFTMLLYAITTEKLSLPLKQDDHLISEISFSAFADDLNRIGYMSTTSATGGGA